MALEVENILEKKPALEEEIKRLKEAIYHFMKQVFYLVIYLYVFIC